MNRIFILLLLGAVLTAADNKMAPALPLPDPRLKADLLLICCSRG
jgi:hypothetical protein